MGQNKLKLKKLKFKVKNGYYPIHKKRRYRRYWRSGRPIRYYSKMQSIRQIKDENILYDIAEKDEDIHNKIYAVRNPNFKDEKKLLKIINKQKGYILRQSATSKLKKEENLVNLVKKHHDWHVRIKALQNNNLCNQKVIKNAALNDKDYMVRREAVKQLEDQDTLVYLSRNDEDVLVRIFCIEKIRNMDIVVYAAGHDSNWRVRKAALDLIDDTILLKELLDNEENKYIQELIKERINILQSI